jgi:hypothetical protein
MSQPPHDCRDCASKKTGEGVNPMRVRYQHPIPGNVVRAMDENPKIQAEIERAILPVSQTR